MKQAGGRLLLRMPIREEADVAVTCSRARALALEEGFPEGRAGAIATAVSEVARNIVVHAGAGEVMLSVVTERAGRAVVVVARDDHPGIRDVEMAMVDGYSTKGGLGLGLSSARRLMDEFAIVSTVGKGTSVTMKKWAYGRGE